MQYQPLSAAANPMPTDRELELLRRVIEQRCALLDYRAASGGLAAHERQEREALAAALQRLDAGDYGRCGACGAEIGFLRLLAHPSAERCLDCEERGAAEPPPGWPLH